MHLMKGFRVVFGQCHWHDCPYHNQLEFGGSSSFEFEGVRYRDFASKILFYSKSIVYGFLDADSFLHGSEQIC